MNIPFDQPYFVVVEQASIGGSNRYTNVTAINYSDVFLTINITPPVGSEIVHNIPVSDVKYFSVKPLET